MIHSADLVDSLTSAEVWEVEAAVEVAPSFSDKRDVMGRTDARAQKDIFPPNLFSSFIYLPSFSHVLSTHITEDGLASTVEDE